MVKLSKAVLVLSVGIFFAIVALNNVIDYGTNFEFVRHVLMMDTTFEGNSLMWRAIDSVMVHHVFYWIIILWEIVVAIFLLVAGFRLFSNKKKVYESGFVKAVIGLTLALLLWFLAFMTIGGEWFAMWQSDIWNGYESAFRMFVVDSLILIYLFIGE